MKLKADKWAKLQGNDEYRQTIMEFLEKQEYNILIIFQNSAGQLQPSFDFPQSMKAKAVYFSKKEKGMNVGKDNFKTALAYGDLSYSPLEQLSALVDEVCFANSACFYKIQLIPGRVKSTTCRFQRRINFLPQNYNCDIVRRNHTY